MTLRSARLPALLVLALVAMWLLAPVVPAARTLTAFRVTVYGSNLLFFVLVTILLARLAPGLARCPLRLLGVVAVGSFVLLMLLNFLEVPIASDLAKLAFGVSLGAMLLRPIDRPWWLLPIAVCVPLADAWSVYSARGVTHAVVAHAATNRAFIDWPTIATPILGYDYAAAGRIGIVDTLFLALFLVAAARWSLGRRRLLVALPIAFVATTVLAYEREGQAVPALPILCVAFLICTLPALILDMRAEFAAVGETAPEPHPLDRDPGEPNT